jgi:pyruvate dehydrogenase E2 component (dihydrolipoamide acetyltransferase)
MPKLGQTMEEGVIVEWVKGEGDPVKRGELLFTVESDKAVLEVEATARGFLRRILVQEGQPVPVLTPVALLTRTADEDISSYGAQEPARPALVPVAAAPGEEEAEVVLQIPEAGEAPPARPEGRIFASPRARKAAREKGVDLAAVPGSGPNGRIVEQDVLAYVAAPPKATPVAVKTAEALGVDLATITGSGPGGRVTKADVEAAAEAVALPAEVVAPAPVEAPAAVERVPVAGMRRIIAERMATSDDATARVTLVTEADATAFVEVRQQLKASVTDEWGYAPGFNDLLGIIVARALGEFPYMNARLSEDGNHIEYLPSVHLGMAVDTERGLLVPVIRHAGQMGLRAFGTEFRALMERARAGRSQPDDLVGGTFTITNLGMYEIDAFTPIINLPETAILGAGRIQAKPVVHKGEIVARQMWSLSLTFDHRLVDGAPAARFLQRIKELVEHPYLLLG